MTLNPSDKEPLATRSTEIFYTFLFIVSWTLFLIIMILTFPLGSQISLIIVILVLPVTEFLIGLKAKEFSVKFNACLIWRRRQQ